MKTSTMTNPPLRWALGAWCAIAVVVNASTSSVPSMATSSSSSSLPLPLSSRASHYYHHHDDVVSRETNNNKDHYLSSVVSVAGARNNNDVVMQLRGGASTGNEEGESSGMKGKQQQRHKKGGKSNKKSSGNETNDASKIEEGRGEQKEEEEDEEDAKNAINKAMKESDAATALGDAIRSRAHILRQDTLPYSERTFDAALVSLGLSLGTAGTDRDTTTTTGGETEESSSSGGRVDTTLAYYHYGHRQSLSPHHNNNNHYNQRRPNTTSMNNNNNMMAGGVPPSPSAVIANYFLNTHGGTHVIQCILSLLASVLGISCLLLPSFPATGAGPSTAATTATVMNAPTLSRQILLSTTKYTLLQQTLLVTLAKHASGFLGAVLLGASRIPELGLRNTRRHLEMVARDPVGQYLFYCGVLVVWMGWFGGVVVTSVGAGGKNGGNGVSVGGGMRDYVARLKTSVVSIMNASASTAAAADDGTTDNNNNAADAVTQLLNMLSQNSPPWYLTKSRGGNIIPIIILAPILLREIISILWVISDVLTLAFTSSGGMSAKFLQGILSACRSVLDAFMSILISSDKWRKADSFQRQRSLAKLVGQISLVMELCVGGILVGDATQAFWRFAFVGPDIVLSNANGSGGSVRLPFKFVVGKIVCAHLYVNFLLSRRKKIQTLVGSIRGGAILDRMLDVLIDPKKEMGLVNEEEEDIDGGKVEHYKSRTGGQLHDKIASALGLME